MILLYKAPAGKDLDLALAFLDRVKLTYRLLDDEAAGHSLNALIDGENSPSGQTADQSAIIFSRDYSEEEVRRILDLILATGLRLQVPILVTEANGPSSLSEVLADMAAQQTFIGTLAHLQQLIDATGRLKEEDYDPDKWSEMKIAIADANDVLADLVGEDAQAAAQAREALTDKREALAASMERLLSYTGPTH